MNNPDLNKLLKIYENKRLSAEKDCDDRVSILYKNNPNLSKIVDEINQTSINLSNLAALSLESVKYIFDHAATVTN